MFKNYRTFETIYAGRTLIVETGKTCVFSNGSCWVKYGETVVMANVTASAKPREGINFFPLSVDYEERLYAIGKIPGSFTKREGKPSEKAIITARCIDRPIRPLFPKDMRNDVAVVITVLAVEPDNLPEIVGMIAASIAISISDIPWNGPIAGINVGLVDGNIILNPTLEQRSKTELVLTVAGTAEKIVMIEASANEVNDDIMLDAIIIGHEEIKKLVNFIHDIKTQIGKSKFKFNPQKVEGDMFDEINYFAFKRIKNAICTNEKTIRDSCMTLIINDIHAKFDEKYSNQIDMIDDCIYMIQKNIIRELLYKGKRVDGRDIDEIRPLFAEVNVLPRVHGSGIFTRGQTQVLTICTLGSMSDAQRIDGLDEAETKRYIHQYNFPCYSVGEAKPSRGPGRREIGHGALAEKALAPVIPPIDEFPYAFRLVSEVLSSNGSTSQSSICGSTLALMDAGVPIKAPVAGISCGLISIPGSDDFITMIDIQGIEDDCGDMDFKVSGTKNGITAIQVDVKVDGLSFALIKQAFEKTRKARLYIIDEIILKTIPSPRKKVNKYAPKILKIQIPVEKIREVIGHGGKVVQKISADCDVKIDIDDEGNVFISGINDSNTHEALKIINTIANGPKIGDIYKGKVVRILDFGAFVEIVPGVDGFVHISKLANSRVTNVKNIVSTGDKIVVKVIEIDYNGKIKLSRKAALDDS